MLLHPFTWQSPPQIVFVSEIHWTRLSRHVSCAFWIFKIFAISGSDTIFITINSSLWARKQQTTFRSPVYPGLRRCVVQTPPRQLSAWATSHSRELHPLSLLLVQAGSNAPGQLGTEQRTPEWALRGYSLAQGGWASISPRTQTFGKPGARQPGPEGALLACSKIFAKSNMFLQNNSISMKNLCQFKIRGK